MTTDQKLTNRTIKIIERGGCILLKRSDKFYLGGWTNIASGPDNTNWSKRHGALEIFDLKWAFVIAKLYNCKVVSYFPKKKCKQKVLIVDEKAVNLKKCNTETYKVTLDDFTTKWYNSKDELHRVGGPAIEWDDGEKNWYKEGKYHRVDGPAIENANGSKFWYKEGKYHREDGPAIEYDDGEKHWYKEGKLHREDGHASEYANGTKLWYKEDKLHRIDGPAVEHPDGDKEYYYLGEYMECNSNEEYFKLLKLKTI